MTTSIAKIKITNKSRDPCHDPPRTASTAVTRALESAETDKRARPLGENSIDVTKIICAPFNFCCTDKLDASTIEISPSVLPIARNLHIQTSDKFKYSTPKTHTAVERYACKPDAIDYLTNSSAYLSKRQTTFDHLNSKIAAVSVLSRMTLYDLIAHLLSRLTAKAEIDSSCNLHDLNFFQLVVSKVET